MRTPLHLAAALLLIGATAAGCGSDAPNTSANATIPSATAEGATSTDPEATTPIGPAGSTPDGSGPCGFAEFAQSLDSTLGDVMDPATDPAAREAAFTDYVAELDRWATVMPPEISDDFAFLVAGARTMQEVLAAADYDIAAVMADPEQLAALQEAIAPDDPEAIDAAGDRLNAWFLENCGIDLEAESDAADGDDGDGTDPLVGARLPFDPCTVPDTVDLAALVDVDLTDGSGGGGSFSSDTSVQVSCSWRSADQSLLSITAIAFVDADAAAGDIRSVATLFGGTIEPLDDRFPAPSFASVFDTLVTIYVLGTDAPFSVSFTRVVPDGDPEPDREVAEAIAQAMLDGLEPVPGGLDLPPKPAEDLPIDDDVELFDGANAEFSFVPCDAITSTAVTALVDTGGTTGSQGSAQQSYHAADSCSAVGTTADGTEVEVTILAVDFDDIDAARADIINSTDGETTADLDGLPDGAFATAGGFWGDAVWVLDVDTPFAVAVEVRNTDPVESDLSLAAQIAIVFLEQ